MTLAGHTLEQNVSGDILAANVTIIYTDLFSESGLNNTRFNDTEWLPQARHKIIASLTCALMAFAVGTNVCVFVAVATSKSLRRINNWLVVCLATTDCLRALCTCALLVSAQVSEIYLERIPCSVFHGLMMSLETLVTLQVTAINIERMFIIVKPMAYQRLASRGRMATWIIMLCAAALAYGLSNIRWVLKASTDDLSSTVSNVCSAPVPLGYLIFHVLFLSAAPLVLILAANAKIFTVVRGQMKRVQPAVTDTSRYSDHNTYNREPGGDCNHNEPHANNPTTQIGFVNETGTGYSHATRKRLRSSTSWSVSTETKLNNRSNMKVNNGLYGPVRNFVPGMARRTSAPCLKSHKFPWPESPGVKDFQCGGSDLRGQRQEMSRGKSRNSKEQIPNNASAATITDVQITDAGYNAGVVEDEILSHSGFDTCSSSKTNPKISHVCQGIQELGNTNLSTFVGIPTHSQTFRNVHGHSRSVSCPNTYVTPSGTSVPCTANEVGQYGRSGSVLKSPKQRVSQRRGSVSFCLQSGTDCSAQDSTRASRPLVDSTRKTRAGHISDEDTTFSSDVATTETSVSSGYAFRADNTSVQSKIPRNSQGTHGGMRGPQRYGSSAGLSTASQSSRRASSVSVSSDVRRRRRSLLSLSNNKAINLALVVVGTFCCYSLPLNIALLVHQLCDHCVPHLVMDVLMLVSAAGTVINPLVYNFYNSEFRQILKQAILRRRSGRTSPH